CGCPSRRAQGARSLRRGAGSSTRSLPSRARRAARVRQHVVAHLPVRAGTRAGCRGHPPRRSGCAGGAGTGVLIRAGADAGCCGVSGPVPAPTLTALAAYLLLVVAHRLSELGISARNERALVARGGYEVGRSHFPLFVVLHTLYPLTLAADVMGFGARPGRLWPLWAALLVASVGLRIAAPRRPRAPAPRRAPPRPAWSPAAPAA